MKIILLVLLSSLLAASGFAQSNLIVFAENGESFTMTVDGSKAKNINDSKVKFEGIKGDFIQAKITFNEQSLGHVKKGFMIEPNSEITAVLKQNKKGVYVIRLVSTVTISNNVSSESPAYPVIVEDEYVNQEYTDPADEVVTTTTTTISESSSSTINIGVNDGNGGIQMNVDININDSEMLQNGQGVSSTSATTTTTTTSSGSSSDDYVYETYTEIGNGCYAMLDSDYKSAKSSIASKAFADDKMILAKQIIKANCVSTDQVVGIMKIFEFEDDKLEFAKVAYEKTTDNQNYYKVNDAFTYSSSIDELNEFLEEK